MESPILLFIEKHKQANTAICMSPPLNLYNTQIKDESTPPGVRPENLHF